MHPDDILRTPREFGDIAHREIRRVGRENGAGARDGVDLLEHPALHVQVLEDRLDDQIDLREVVIGQGR